MSKASLYSYAEKRYNVKQFITINKKYHNVSIALERSVMNY